jgi:hypothetical protein
MLPKVTVTLMLRAVLLVGWGEKTTTPEPEHGRTSEVGMAWDPYWVKRKEALFAVDVAAGNTKLAVID